MTEEKKTLLELTKHMRENVLPQIKRESEEEPDIIKKLGHVVILQGIIEFFLRKLIENDAIIKRKFKINRDFNQNMDFQKVKKKMEEYTNSKLLLELDDLAFFFCKVIDFNLWIKIKDFNTERNNCIKKTFKEKSNMSVEVQTRTTKHSIDLGFEIAKELSKILETT